MDSFVRVPQDSDGKALSTSVLVVNGIEVHRQKIIHADPVDPAGLASVKNVPPVPTDYGSIVRPLEPSCLTFPLLSVIGDNASVVKNSAGVVYGYDLYNQAAYPIFVKLYNKATAPNPATDGGLLLRIIGLQAGTGKPFALKRGIGGFTSGIALAITLHAALNDDTPVAAGDCIVNLDYL